jgi:DNA polymerase I-like protein with 3'-5' exonuclease and polymerase domains
MRPDAIPIPYEACETCKGTCKYTHPAAQRAQDVVDARKAKYEIDFYDKLIIAGRLHASFVIIGTLSSRMAGTDQLNAQGIKKDKKVRSCFPLAWPGTILSGGDFSGFEVVLAEACYNDPDLRKDLMTGKKIHGLFGVFVYPEMTYEEILASDGTANDVYTKAKSAVFAMLYGGEGFTLKERLGVPIEVADEAYRKFCARYPGVGRARQRIIDMFQSLRQPNGIGTQVEWHEPADYIESMFGFRRYFTLENRISKALYDLANKPPASWKNIKVKVMRRDREQTATGAVQSALFGATFALQASNMRAAANHVIQSSGAQITKLVQRRIWDIQPSGIGEWLVQPMNVHDEVMCPTHPSVNDKVKEVVDETVESLRPKVPLIKMGWKKILDSWAGKS